MRAAGRWGLPSDRMGPVVFLESSASDYINGYTVAVEGGWLAKKYFCLEEGGRRYFFRQGQKGTSAHASYQINIAD